MELGPVEHFTLEQTWRRTAAVCSLPWTCQAEKKKQATGCSAAMHIEAPVEDRNRIWV